LYSFVVPDGLDVPSIYFDCHRLGQHCNGKDEPTKIFLANQDPLNALECTSNHPNMHAAFQERVRLYPISSSDGALNRFYLHSRDNCNVIATVKDHVDSRGGHNLKAAIVASAHEEIARE